MKISIIVPVYNVEKFLTTCLDSILSQKYTNFELLLIDDGSTDRSGEICDNYSVRDKRVRVIHQNNSGVAVARNNGIKAATGKYVCFVDSDDYVSSEYLSDFLTSPIDDSTIVVQNMKGSKNKFGISAQWPSGTFCKEKCKELFIDYDLFNFGGPCCKLFPVELLRKNHLLFPTFLYFGEDTIFFLKVLLHITVIQYHNKSNYYYRDSGASSLSHKVHRVEMLLRFYFLYYYYIQKLNVCYCINDKHYLQRESTRLLLYCISAILNLYRLPYSLPERLRLLKLAKKYLRREWVFFKYMKFSYRLCLYIFLKIPARGEGWILKWLAQNRKIV